MTTPPLRVAIAGAGMISEHHLHGWKSVPGAAVVAVVDPHAGRAAARAAQFGIPHCFADLDALLAALPVDALDIASPRETHGPLLRAAAARGLPVLCQKPFMPTLAEAESVVRDTADRCRVMVNQNFRFRPYYQTMARWIAGGRLGALTGCTISCRASGLIAGPDGRYPYIERQPFVRYEKRMMIEEVLLHRLDIARWLCGPLAVVAARTRHSCPELAGESEATLLLETAAEGAPVVVEGNFAAAGFPAQSRDRVEIIGATGRITLDDHSVLRLHGSAPEEIAFEHAAVYQQSFDATIAHFVGCLRSGAPFLAPPSDNLETIRLVEAAYRAAGE